MHINWATKVSFPCYLGPQLPAALQHEIATATDDDLLAAYLHWTEGRIAIDFAIATKELTEEIKAEQEHIDALTPPVDTPFTDDYRSAHAALRLGLSKVRTTVERAHEEAWTIWNQLCEQTSRELTSKYRDTDVSLLSGMERIGHLKSPLTNAEQTLHSALSAHREAMHTLALGEHTLQRFLESPDSVALEDIHVMTPSMFEQTVAALARRDGHHVTRDGGGARDLGADVIAVTADGRRIVFQCKHGQGGHRKVGSPDIQTLNGTARPEHNADIVVAVTNGTFTKPASGFARTHDIHLLGQEGLKRWATWGNPLLTIIGAQE